MWREHEEMWSCNGRTRHTGAQAEKKVPDKVTNKKVWKSWRQFVNQIMTDTDSDREADFLLQQVSIASCVVVAISFQRISIKRLHVPVV